MKIYLLNKTADFIKIISYFIPKKQNQIIFYSVPDFSDNSKALYDEIVKQGLYKKYNLVWVVKHPEKYIATNQNTRFVAHKSIKGIWGFMRSKYIIRTHSFMGNRYVKRRQYMVNLFHGQPLKGIGTTEIPSKKMKRNHFEFMPVTSDFFRMTMGVCFNVEISRIFITGLPRNDLLYETRGVLQSLGIKQKYRKIIIWMPTFRNSKLRHNDGIQSDSGLPIITKKDISFLNEYLHRKNVLLIVKFHPWADRGSFIDHEYSNILLLEEDMIPTNFSLYNIIGATDVLLTDYSSVYIDYLLLNKPIGFVFDDIEKFKQTRGGLYEDMTDYMPGEKINTTEQLYSFIDDICNGKDIYKDEREQIRKIFFKYRDNQSCKRIIDKIGL